MTHAQKIEVVAEAIRDAWDKHSQEKHGVAPLTSWDRLPDDRKMKWRKMAQAAFEVIRS